MPQRLAGPRHSHRERQQRKQYAARGVVILDKRLVDANPRVVVGVAGLGDAHYGMQQQRGVEPVHCALGELFVGAVQRVAGLERHHIGGGAAFQRLAGLRGR